MLKKYSRQIVKWTLIGILARVILMPITMHGQDLVFINYFPFIFVENGIWDPYGFINANFPYFTTTYYGPVLFIIMSAVNFVIIKLCNPVSLIAMLELSATMMGKQFTTFDYANVFFGAKLFKNLFIMKSSYLIFDFAIGAMLLKLANSRKSALWAYKLWMLNIVVLQCVYAVGGAELIVTFFIVAALYAACKNRPYLAVALLSLGGATKLFPYMLILPTCLLLGNNWKERFTLLFTGGLVTVLPYLPFYLSSGNSVFRFFLLTQNVQYYGVSKLVLSAIFIVLYTFVSINAIKDSRTSQPEQKLLYYFTVIMFLTFAAFPVRFRYFTFISPLLFLVIPQHRKFGIFISVIILMLAFQWLTPRDLQLGLFAPLNPSYFLNLPTFQEVIGRFVNVEVIYKCVARALVVAFLAAAWWIWHVKPGSKRRGMEVFC